MKKSVKATKKKINRNTLPTTTRHRTTGSSQPLLARLRSSKNVSNSGEYGTPDYFVAKARRGTRAPNKRRRTATKLAAVVDDENVIGL